MRCLLLCALACAIFACAHDSEPQVSIPATSHSLAKDSASAQQISPAGAPMPKAKVAVKPVVAPAETRLVESMGKSTGASKVIGVLLHLRESVMTGKYQGRTVIRKDEGYYAWDCSGMANWILKRSAPRAYRALGKPRPVARDFFKKIEASPTRRPRKGWQKLNDVSEARPGDVFSWLRSPASKSKISGHVGFLVSKPVPLESDPSLYVARIVDATSLPHGEDTRPREGEGGFGFGTLLFATDDDGKTIAYGWHGKKSVEWGFMPAYVNFGRVIR